MGQGTVASGRGGGRRLEVTLLATLALLAAAGWGAIVQWGADAPAEGRSLYAYRTYLQNVLAIQPTRRPLVAWLGDSTIVGQSYPQRMEDWLQRHYRAESRVVAYVGLTTYNYYELMGPVLALRPAVVVLVANLRTLFVPRADQPIPTDLGGFDDLASMIPEDELPRALTLPWQVRGLSLPRLLLLRLLRFEAVEQSMYLFEGLRSLAQRQRPWEAVAPPTPLPESVVLEAYLEVIRVMEQRYDQPITAGAPFVRMLGATVDMARRRGVRVLVVASPIPFEQLQRSIGYDRAMYAQRFATLRAVTEASGGAFVDYHEALQASGFRDQGGHFTDGGATALAQILREPLGAELDAALHRGPGRVRRAPAP